MRILLLEDHPETRLMLQRLLREAGHAPETAPDLASARQKLSMGGYGALVVDWMLPGGAGIDLCRELRQSGDTTPLLMLTARDAVEDRVRGLDAGADDYMKKPFAAAELLARVRALARRGPRLESQVVTIGPAEFRLDERRVLVDGGAVPVTAREFAILEVLLRRKGQAVGRSAILEAVWGENSAGAAASLEVLIGRLRRKLMARAGTSIIRTLRGFGYSIGQPH